MEVETMKTLKKIPMFGRIIIGFAVGIILGLIFREKAAVLAVSL